MTIPSSQAWRETRARASARMRRRGAAPGPPGTLTRLRRHLARRERLYVLLIDQETVAGWGDTSVPGVTVRSVAPADAPALEQFTDPPETLRRLSRGDFGSIAVLDEDGRAVGCTWIATRRMDAEEHIISVRPKPNEAYGYGLAVEEGMRQRGIGRALVTASRQRATALGVERILSHVEYTNDAQFALQRSIGTRFLRAITTVVVLDRFALILRNAPAEPPEGPPPGDA